MARVDYKQVPEITNPKLEDMWIAKNNGCPDNYDNLKYIDNKFLNSINRLIPGIALVGTKKASGKWCIIKIWRDVN